MTREESGIVMRHASGAYIFHPDILWDSIPKDVNLTKHHFSDPDVFGNPRPHAVVDLRDSVRRQQFSLT